MRGDSCHVLRKFPALGGEVVDDSTKVDDLPGIECYFYLAAQGLLLAAQGFFAEQGFFLAAQGFFLAAQGFFLAAQGLLAFFVFGAHGFRVAHGFWACAAPPRPRANRPAQAS